MRTIGARSPMILMAMIEGGEQYEYTALLVTDAVRALALCRGPLPVPKLFAPAFVPTFRICCIESTYAMVFGILWQ